VTSRLRARIYLRLVEYTAIPLYIGLYLMLISGYGMVTPRAAWLTLGLMDRHISTILHVLSPLSYVVGVLAALHAIGGFGVLILRRVRRTRVAAMLEALNLLANSALVAQLTILEFL